MDIRDKIKEKTQEWKDKQAELHHHRLRKVAHKRVHQRRNGWPSDKSPI